jgi:hypothetical protein
MLVQIKCSRLFVGYFSEVVAKSVTNVCPDQVLKTFCWFFCHKLLLGQEPMFDQEHLDDYNLIYFAL